MLVAAEQGPGGVQLIALDERGDRRFELLEPARDRAVDKNPAISPDRKWIVFASTRGRQPSDGTTLWIAPVGYQTRPRPLTGITPKHAIDTQPTWTVNGDAIVFASTRRAGDYDLWRLAIVDGQAVGPATPITDSPRHEITPTIADDGAIAYTVVDGARSWIEERAADGAVHKLTDGPADQSPAYAPDGKTVAFARGSNDSGQPHTELWQIARRAAAPSRIIALPLTDESGPVWSRDGRFLFATSRLSGAETRTLFSSIVVIDLAEQPPTARMLRDRAGAVPRLTPAVAARRLDARRIHDAPEYMDELARVVARELAEQRDDRR